MAFPTSLDGFTDVQAGGLIQSATINALNTAAETLQSKVGIDNSPIPTSLDYRTGALEDYRDDFWINVTLPPYNAVGDGSTNNHTAIQAAIDAAGDVGCGTLYFPPGSYVVNSPLDVSGSRLTFKGAASTDLTTVGDGSMITTSSGNLFETSSASRNNVFEDLRLRSSGGGHVFSLGGSCTFWTWNRIHMSVAPVGKSLIDASAAAGFYDNLIIDSYLRSTTSGQTVPLVNLPSNLGTVNSNTFMRLRCERGGNYVFYIEESQAGNYAHDNVFRDITFEITNGGNIKILSGRSNVIENCNTYDLSGATTKDLFYIGASAAGPDSIGNVIRSSSRRGGSLGGGLSDIKLASGESTKTLIENCNGAIDLGSNTAKLVNLLYNDSPAASVSNRTQNTLEPQEITANRQTASYTLVIGDASKVIEMNVGSANDLTVPPNADVAFPVGTVIEVMQYGAGQTTIVAGSGVTLRSPSGNLKISAQYGAASLRKIATNEWAVEGSLTA